MFVTIHDIQHFFGKERYILFDPWRPVTAAPVWNYLEICWPCAGGLSAVNDIGTQLRDSINSGLTRWRMGVSISKWAMVLYGAPSTLPIFFPAVLQTGVFEYFFLHSRLTSLGRCSGDALLALL
jgi:hypothetical protein